MRPVQAEQFMAQLGMKKVTRKPSRMARLLSVFGFNSTRIAEGGSYYIRDPKAAQRAGFREENPENFRGNKYQDYPTLVEELTKKFLNHSVYGCGAAHTVVTFLARSIVGTGAELSANDPAPPDPAPISEPQPLLGQPTPPEPPEPPAPAKLPPPSIAEKFCQAYTRWNKLDGMGAYNAITVGVIEGKCLRVPMVVSSDDPRDVKDWGGKKVITKSIRYAKVKYKINTNGEITYASSDEVQHKPGEYVLVQIDGFEDDPNDTPSAASKAMNQFESLDHAMTDFRLYNKTFPGVTPVFSVPSREDANWLFKQMFYNAGIDGNGNVQYIRTWEMGDSLVLPGGTATMLEPSGNNVKGICEEIFMCYRMISGICSIPVILIGPVDLAANRATAQELPEMINIGTTSSRESWEAGFVEEVKLAAAMLTAATKIGIETQTITCDMPFSNMSWLKLLSEFWLQLGLRDIISKQTLQEMIPGVDPNVEKVRLHGEKTAAAAMQRATFMGTPGKAPALPSTNGKKPVPSNGKMPQGNDANVQIASGSKGASA